MEKNKGNKDAKALNDNSKVSIALYSPRKYLSIIKITLENKLVYFWDLIGNNMFFIFIIFVYLMLWKRIYGQGDTSLGELSLNQMIWYLIVTEIITLSRASIPFEVSREVKSGNIAYLISRPYNYISYCFSCFLGEMGIKLAANCLLGIIIGIVYVGPLKTFYFPALPLVIISILLGASLNFFIYMLLSLSAFWLEDNNAFFWIYSKLIFTLGGMLVPIDLFPIWLQGLSKYLPFAYVTYVPAKLAVDFRGLQSIKAVGIQFIYLIIFGIITYWVYGKGVKKLNVNGG